MFVPEGLWVVDPGASRVRFSVKHLLVATVEGSFGAVAGTISADGRSLQAEGSVQVATIDTGMKDRDVRLRGAGFFDAEQVPGASLQRNRRPRRVRRQVGCRRRPHDQRPHGADAVPRIVSEGDRGPRIVARGSLSRREHGLDWPGLLHSGRAVVGDRVTIELDLALR